jgi:hypothetical protein
MKVTKRNLEIVAEKDAPVGHVPADPCFVLENDEIRIRSKATCDMTNWLANYEPHNITHDDVNNVNAGLEMIKNHP